MAILDLSGRCPAKRLKHDFTGATLADDLAEPLGIHRIVDADVVAALDALLAEVVRDRVGLDTEVREGVRLSVPVAVLGIECDSVAGLVGPPVMYRAMLNDLVTSHSKASSSSS
jgi:hypothetical protein